MRKMSMLSHALVLLCSVQWLLLTSIAEAQVDTTNSVPATNTVTTTPTTSFTTEESLNLTTPTIDEDNQELDSLLAAEKHETELLLLQREKERLALENQLLEQKQQRELAKLKAQKEKLTLENDISAAKQTQALKELTQLKQELELEKAIAEQRLKLDMAELEAEKTRITLQNDLEEQHNRQKQLDIDFKKAKLDFERAKMEFHQFKENFEKGGDISERIARRDQQRLWDNQVNKSVEYLVEPYVDNILYISDRRIALDGPIITGTGVYINERIHFYNNKNAEYPIFIVIDNCVGGSVMEGAKIVRAMHSSRAPIYVVVKSYAASMCAVITAMADKSFAYPDAMIIHHQMLSLLVGNMTQHRESLAVYEEWSHRLLAPVAHRMGITLDEMVAQMYENNSDGNWREFASEAVNLNWLDVVVEEIREQSYIQRPNDKEDENIATLALNQMFNAGLTEKLDAQGKTYVELPPLMPTDFYHLYDPQNYYRYNW